MSESIEFLENSPEAGPTDKYLCDLVRTHRIADEIGTQFSMDDPNAVVDVNDTRNQFAMKAFERQLDRSWTIINKGLIPGPVPRKCHPKPHSP